MFYSLQFTGISALDVLAKRLWDEDAVAFVKRRTKLESQSQSGWYDGWNLFCDIFKVTCVNGKIKNYKQHNLTLERHGFL